MALHLMGAGSEGRERGSDQRECIISYVCFGGSRLNARRISAGEGCYWSRPVIDCRVVPSLELTRSQRVATSGVAAPRGAGLGQTRLAAVSWKPSAWAT